MIRFREYEERMNIRWVRKDQEMQKENETHSIPRIQIIHAPLSGITVRKEIPSVKEGGSILSCRRPRSTSALLSSQISEQDGGEWREGRGGERRDEKRRERRGGTYMRLNKLKT